MNTDEYPPSIHINNARTKLRWHGLDTTSNYCLAWDELSQRDCRFVAEFGLEHAAIAMRLGISVETARQRFHRAIEHLRELLHRQYPDGI
jgi:hypothetical protein